jgi:Na+-driven multidrug efflux pump
MSLILGMDLGVFCAWIGTLLATVLCILYGVYYQFFKKSNGKKQTTVPKKKKKKQEDE